MTIINLPSNFHLTTYRFTIETLEAFELPPFKGSALRGGFGHIFKKLTCATPTRCHENRCQLGNDCPYGYVFETGPPADAEVLRKVDNIPRPFIIQAPADRSTQLQTGQQLTFGLILIGGAIRYLPHFIAVFRSLGYQGLGRQRGRYRLVSVETCHPVDLRVETIYRDGSELIRVPDRVITAADLHHLAQTLPADRLTLNFLTPTRLKSDGKWVDGAPPFQAIIRNLLGRLSSLSYFHCGQAFEADFRGLIDRAAEVSIEQTQVARQDWGRYSGRQKQRIELGGTVGEVTYRGPLTDYHPLLIVGEWLHLGKGTVFGNGQYRILGT